jgi:hypothetical protein
VRESRITSSASALVINYAADYIQREEAEPYHSWSLFSSCSLHGRRNPSEKKQNHMISPSSGMLLIAFSLFFALHFPQHSIKVSESHCVSWRHGRSRITSPPTAARADHTATWRYIGWYQQRCVSLSWLPSIIPSTFPSTVKVSTSDFK